MKNLFNKRIVISVILMLFVSFSFSQKIGKTLIDENGKKIVETIIDGRPPAVLPQPSKNLPKEKIKGVTFWLDSIPSYDWSYGCSATTIAMQAGYFDNTDYPNIYTGPANGGVQPMTNAVWNSQASHSGTNECPVSATAQNVDSRDKKGHADDYWIDYLEEGDPYYENWSEHTPIEAGYNICTADFMGTNQWYNYSNVDGSTSFYNYQDGTALYDYTGCEPADRDGCHGIRLFYEACGVTVIDNFSQYILGYNGITSGYTFADYKNEIDNGNPVLINVVGHSMLGYGYDNTDEAHPKVYLRNTWTQDRTVGGEQMEWGGSYSGMDHYAVSVIHLQAPPLTTPENVEIIFDGANVVLTWYPTGATSYNVYSSDDPYGSFTLEASVGTNQYIIASSEAKLFYYIVSSDSK
ncbi:MAG: hypothetical protein JXR69_05155 [Candidatus Delongbacteria bacterium]|nr:hypothetical protein [Candidatus Delongbacteria bacterium]